MMILPFGKLCVNLQKIIEMEVEAKKIMDDFKVAKVRPMGAYALLEMEGELPGGIRPGQFVQIEIPDSKTTYLRRPISICNVEDGHLWLLVRDAGAGTHRLVNAAVGDKFSIILPLGHGFTVPTDTNARVLLAGGGVGVAPLLYLAKTLRDGGLRPDIVLGARSKSDVLLREEFEHYGQLHISTDDGSDGTPGLITANPVFSGEFDAVAVCGPTPMMRAVAAICAKRGIRCEVSLENMMACGLGACLCCVEDTKEKGNVCVCTDGPVFNINELKWDL